MNTWQKRYVFNLDLNRLYYSRYYQESRGLECSMIEEYLGMQDLNWGSWGSRGSNG